MQCPNTDLPPARRDVLRRRRQSGDDRALCAGSRAGRRHGTPDAALHVPGGRNALRHGTAALPPADMEDDAHPHVGQMRAIPAQDGRHDPDRFDGRMVPELLPPQRRGRHDGPLRELLPRASGAKLCADIQSAGTELEGGRGTAVGCPGQGDRRQHARRALSRRRGGGKLPGAGTTEIVTGSGEKIEIGNLPEGSIAIIGGADGQTAIRIAENADAQVGTARRRARSQSWPAKTRKP